MTKLRVHEVTVSQQPASHLRVYEVSVAQVAVNIPDLGAAQLVESTQTVTVTGTIPGTVSTWAFTATPTVGSPTVVLSGSGATRTFTAPTAVDGATYTIAATATISGVVSPAGVTVVTVNAHQWWVLRAGGWVPFAGPVSL